MSTPCHHFLHPQRCMRASCMLTVCSRRGYHTSSLCKRSNTKQVAAAHRVHALYLWCDPTTMAYPTYLLPSPLMTCPGVECSLQTLRVRLH